MKYLGKIVEGKDLANKDYVDKADAALNDIKVDKVEGKVLSTNDYTTAEKEKLAGIADNANKYVHPSHTAHASGLYKVTVDAEGHVSDATAATKTDITALGIPAQDTTYDEATTSKAGLMPASAVTKLAGIEDGADANIIESVKVNGAALTVTDKAVDITVPDGALADKDKVSESDFDSALAAKVVNWDDAVTKEHTHSNKAELDLIASGDKAKWDAAKTTADAAASAIEVLNGNESTSGSVAHTVKEYVDSRLTSAYKAAGSTTFADLPTPSATNEGYVYNVTDAFTTDSRFVETAGGEYAAGTNVVVVEASTDVYKFDVLAGFVDLSGYVQDSELTELTNTEVQAIWNSIFTS